MRNAPAPAIDIKTEFPLRILRRKINLAGWRLQSFGHDHAGGRIVIVPAEDHNFKITYPNDLLLAEAILKQRALSQA